MEYYILAYKVCVLRLCGAPKGRPTVYFKTCTTILLPMQLNLKKVNNLTLFDPYYLISELYDGKFKYYRTPRVFAVEIRKYHHKNRLEKFYEIEQCKIAINNKLAILEQRKLTIPYYIQYTRRM
jgi:hypothetical protein